MAGTEIVTVEGGSELKDFIDLPWRIYAEYPNWVPPLKKEVRRMLDSRRHPFWEFSERILFLARRGSETVGRIAGIIDRHYNQFHDEKMGIWGFFECADDPEAAAALFSSAEAMAPTGFPSGWIVLLNGSPRKEVFTSGSLVQRMRTLNLL